MDQLKRQALLSWAAVGLLGLLCAVLAILQYKWVGQVSRAQQERHRKEIQTSLNQLAANFNAQLNEAVSALRPTAAQIEASSREEAYAARYRNWRAGGRGPLFRSIALAIPQDGEIALQLLDPSTARFNPAPWPESWNPMHQYLLSRLGSDSSGPADLEETSLFEIPRFGRDFRRSGDAPTSSRPPGTLPPPPEAEWLILDLDPDYAGKVILPRLVEQYLGEGGSSGYRVEVAVRSNPSVLVYHSGPASEEKAEIEASVPLFDAQQVRPPEARKRPSKRWRPVPPSATESGRGRWQLSVMHASGVVEGLVARARWQNLAISAAIFLLMFSVVAALVRFSRQAQQLAELQMNFVANVSHELRTPLTVIRTAAHNLKGRVADNPTQVERYGQLIQQESERLSVLVEQVLRFAGARTGNVIREKTPVAVENVIEDGLRASKVSLESSHCTVDKQLESGLPLIMADEMALRHAIQNLLDNAVKYGTEASSWIGVSASAIHEADAGFVEIRVSDRGPGIPQDEQDRIFDPFFRGRRAIMDQIHGTGLGLNLVKKIVEAHGGTVHVRSEPMKGTTFIVKIPIAPPEFQDEFAHSFD